MTGPGRPPTSVTVCQEIHALLLENGILPGTKVPRPLWDELVGQAAGVGYAQSCNITTTGVMHGLWERRVGVGRIQGNIVLKEAKTAS